MTRTTILLETELMMRLKQLARSQGKTLTAIIREALTSYLNGQQPAERRLSFTAVGRGKLKNVSENAEEIIKRNLDRREGFNHGDHR